MKLKSSFFSTLAAGAVLTITAISAPANAAVVTGSLNIDQLSGVRGISTNQIDFDNTDGFFSVDANSTGTFASLVGNNVTFLQDIGLPFSGEFNFLKVDDGSPLGIIFRVTGLQDPEAKQVGRGQAFSSVLLGKFISGDDATPTSLDNFLIAGTNKSNNTSSILLSIDADANPAAVPTPALLPGLFGMGAAAMRKRRASAEAASEA